MVAGHHHRRPCRGCPVTEWWVWPAVAALGAVGALIRFGVANLRSRGGRRPTWAIVTVNLVGALMAGFLAGLDHPVAWLLAVGFAGSLTTLSTVAVWMAEDFTARRPLTAVTMALVHVLGGMPVALAGFALSHSGGLTILT